MSYTTLYAVPKNGPIYTYEEYQNSWGGGMFIWYALRNKYYPEDIIFDFKKTCDLFYNKDIPKFERIVLGSTFDSILLKKENFLKYTENLYKFYEVYYNLNTNVVCSLYQQADDIIKMQKEDVVACCWCQTSVSGDIWHVKDDELEDGYRLFDISKDKKTIYNRDAWFLFDELEKD